MDTREIRQRITEMGILRNMLQGLAVVFILILPFSRPTRVLEGWDLFFGGIVPALAPIIFVIMMFDVMMASILRGEAEPAQALILRRAIRTYLVLGFILMGLWILSFRNVLF